MVLLEFSMFPLDKGESLSPFVARSLDIIDRSGVPYQCHAMGTTLEGEFDQVIEVVRECFQAMSADCDRVECTMKIDYRKDHQGRLEAKVASVEHRLGRAVKR
ncbi:MAG: MTH1187 family thiamine-binding protein [Candidatus Nealsonbacteria bacterium]|nr:MTH1187 family thiamine-binding protein [Candidatus Nealsonbacteria bacterium]